MLVLELKEWDHFRAAMDRKATRQQLEAIGRAAVSIFKAGSRAAGGGPKHSSSRKSASVPGQYPAVQSGALIASLDYDVKGDDELEVGTNVHYSVYLRYGTSKMKERNMSDEALEAGMKAVRMTGKHWIRWEYGEP